MSPASSLDNGNWQMSTNVECDRELMGLKVRLPHSFNQISERMFSRIGDLKPALMKASDTFWARSVMLPSSSPIGKRSPSMCWTTPGAINAEAG